MSGPFFDDLSVFVAGTEEERNKLFHSKVVGVICTILLSACDEATSVKPFFPINTVLAAINHVPNQKDAQKNKDLLWSQASCCICHPAICLCMCIYVLCIWTVLDARETHRLDGETIVYAYRAQHVLRCGMSSMTAICY